MSVVVVDTDIVSFRFKKDTRARLYKRHLIGQEPLIAFMTVVSSDPRHVCQGWHPTWQAGKQPLRTPRLKKRGKLANSFFF
jgi:hypothetical protein